MMSIASCWWKLRFLVAEGQKEICQLSCDCSAAWGAVLQLFHTSCVMCYTFCAWHYRRHWFYKHSFVNFHGRDNVCKDSLNLQRAYFQTTNFCVYVSFFASPQKNWISWKSTKPKTWAPSPNHRDENPWTPTTPQGCAMHSRVSSADPAPFEHLEVTFDRILHDTSGNTNEKLVDSNL